MTDEKLRRGQELQKLINTCREFLGALAKIDINKDSQASITVCGNSSSYNASVLMHHCPHTVAAMCEAMVKDLEVYEEEFKAL